MASQWSAFVWFLSALSLSWSQIKFDCPSLPPLAQPAQTVHELRPQDIKVVMALGDSITAGFAMMGAHGADVLEDISEYRGRSWSMGMEDGAITMPNFLRHYSPHLVGGSLGHHLVESCYGVLCPPYQYRPKEDVFNAAQSGAMVFDLVSPELKYLKEQLEEHKEVDMQNDWKLLTLFIGVNDLCLGCSGDVPGLSVDDYDKHLREVLKEVEASIPKVFVNLVLMGNISEIYKLSLKSEYCIDVHRYFPFECVCAFSPGKIGNTTRLDLDRMVAAINGRMRKIAADYANKSDDFAVVLQPFLSCSNADNLTVEYLSSVDCFHPSLVAHQSMAVALWNNMITPAAEKKASIRFGETIKCPTKETLLYSY